MKVKATLHTGHARSSPWKSKDYTPFPKRKKSVLGGISYKELPAGVRRATGSIKCVGKPPGRETTRYPGSRVREEDVQLGKPRQVACVPKGSEEDQRGRRRLATQSWGRTQWGGCRSQGHPWLDGWAPSAKWTAITPLHLTSCGQGHVRNYVIPTR